MSERYFLSSDDGHWYVGPVRQRAYREHWRTLYSDDPEAWGAPMWAEPLGGAPSLLPFEEPKITLLRLESNETAEPHPKSDVSHVQAEAPRVIVPPPPEVAFNDAVHHWGRPERP